VISLDGGIDLANVFGSWPNVMQGLASAVVGGIVAALTALLVVWLTRRGQQRLADELDARQSARALLERIRELVAHGLEDAVRGRDVQTSRSLHIDFKLAMSTYTPAIESIDPVAFSRDIRPLIDLADHNLGSLAGLKVGKQQRQNEAEDIGALLGDSMRTLIAQLSKWQLERQSPRRRH
jgi:hypothetical protein